MKLYSDKEFLGSGYKKNHSPVTEYLYKLSKIKDRMQTETSKKIAQEKHKLTTEYFSSLNKEIKGKI